MSAATACIMPPCMHLTRMQLQRSTGIRLWHCGTHFQQQWFLNLPPSNLSLFCLFARRDSGFLYVTAVSTLALLGAFYYFATSR